MHFGRYCVEVAKSPPIFSLSQEPRLSCHSELSVSSGEVGEEEGRGGGGGESPYSNGEVMTNGEEADMEVDGDEGEEEKERMIEEEEEVIDVERNPVAIEKILAFGRDLQTLHTRVSSGHSNDHLKTLLQVKENLYIHLTYYGGIMDTLKVSFIQYCSLFKYITMGRNQVSLERCLYLEGAFS